MNGLYGRLKGLRFSERSVPFALLVLCVLAFGLLIPSLGFYWDDWPVVVMGKIGEARNFWDFYVYDRPFSAWTYILTMPILGTRPLAWQLFTLGLRWLAAVLAWLLLAELWPSRRKEAAWTAALFAVHPVFLQQPISVAYSQHWTCAVLYMASMFAMVRAWRQPRLARLWTIIALFTSALGLFTMEYFLGLELLRPLALWFLAGEETAADRRARLRRTSAQWLPYLLMALAFIFWRLFVLKLPGADANRPELLFTILGQPVSGMLTLLQMMLQDTVQILFGAWSAALQPAQILLASTAVLVAWGVGIGAAILLTIYLKRLVTAPATEPSGESLAQMWIFGLAWTLLGPLPVWLTGKQLIVGYYSDRFGLPSMVGASLLIVALLVWLTPRLNVQVLLLSVLIALAVSRQIGISNEFRRAWDKQRTFYWELYWRAPSISPHTPFISDGEIFPYVGTYSTTSGLNLLYGREGDPSDFAYWFYSMGRKLGNQMDRFLAGKTLRSDFRTWRFAGESTDSLALFYDGQRCLRLLEDGRPENATLPPLILPAVPFSNLGRISAVPAGLQAPPADIFGREPEHTWCYYYEKAELALQAGDWPGISKLGESAEAAGYAPYDPIERFVFIEGYARSGKIEDAVGWSEIIHQDRPDYDPLLCELWDERILPASADVHLHESRASMTTWLACPPP